MSEHVEILKQILDVFKQQKKISTEHARAHIIIHLSTLTHLIELDLVTAEQAAQRLELLQAALSADDHYGASIISQVASSLRSVGQQPERKWTPEVILGGLSLSDPDDESS